MGGGGKALMYIHFIILDNLEISETTKISEPTEIPATTEIAETDRNFAIKSASEIMRNFAKRLTETDRKVSRNVWPKLTETPVYWFERIATLKTISREYLIDLAQLTSKTLKIFT